MKGVGPATSNQPRKNLTGDPYYTDGLRTVLVLSDELVDIRRIQRFNWEEPPQPPLDWRALEPYRMR